MIGKTSAVSFKNPFDPDSNKTVGDGAATDISIGVAVVKRETCFAALGMDPSCNYCFDRCPLKNRAITFERGPVVHKENCTGCGICIYYCVSNPKSIRIYPS